MTLLAERMKEFGIPRPPYEPAFDLVVVYPLPDAKSSRETFVPDGVIVKAQTTKAAEERSSPRGVLVGAGLKARDYLRGYLIELGHIVWLSRLSPWRHVVERGADGKDVELYFLSVTDIKGSEDVAKLIADGKARVYCDKDGRHVFEHEAEALPRFDPPAYDL